MVKKKSKSEFWKRVHFKYRISAINENTLEEIWKLRASIFWVSFLVILFAFVMITFTSLFIIATPVRYYLPGYLDSEVRGEAIRAAIRIDSLEQQVHYQTEYNHNLQDVFAGKLQIDSVKVVGDMVISEDDPKLKKSKSEADFVKKYEEAEKYNLSVVSPTSNNQSDGTMFFKPVSGVVLDKFNPSRQKFGITITTPAKETVAAILEGTIISVGYDIQWGNVIQIQHKNGYISIYKKVSTQLKNVGDKVRTGEAIATISTEENNDANKSVLYLELWYKGAPLNPEEYITF